MRNAQDEPPLENHGASGEEDAPPYMLNERDMLEARDEWESRAIARLRRIVDVLPIQGAGA